MSNLRILVVDDDVLIGMLLGDMLRTMDHSVCATALTQEDAVADAAEHLPDLMIVDVRLGRGSGIEAVDEILLSRNVPYFFMTGNIAKLRALRPHSAALEKPFGEAELASAIRLATRCAASPQVGPG